MIDKACLFNLSSGMLLSEDIADEILNISILGSKLAEEFKMQRLYSNNINFHSPISRSKYKTFSATKKTVTIRKNKQTKSIPVNRDILGTLLSFSIKYGKVVDFDKALRYPLSPIPLSLCNGDGTKRKTNESIGENNPRQQINSDSTTKPNRKHCLYSNRHDGITQDNEQKLRTRLKN